MTGSGAASLSVRAYASTMIPTAAVVLAAGRATRFGGRKLLAPLDGRPVLQHVLDLVAAAPLNHVVVVLGTDAAEIEAVCVWRDEQRVINDDPGSGLAGSVRLGLRALHATDAQRAAVLLGDQPFLTAEQLSTVTGASGSIVVPRYGGVPGNPVVLDRAVWSLAESLEGDRGLSQLFEARRDIVRYVAVPGTNPDIDTRADLEAFSRA